MQSRSDSTDRRRRGGGARLAWARRGLLAASLVLAAVAQGCGEPAAARAPHPVLLVAVDGFEWDVVLALLREGRLPRLRGLMERGVYGELRSLKPTSSPVIWTSIATGRGSEHHGIRGFKKKTGGESRLAISTDRRTKAFWNVASDLGLRVATVGWWLTWPVEPVNGVMVAQVNTVGPRHGVGKGSLVAGLEHQVHPPELQDEILALIPSRAELDAVAAGIFEAAWNDGLGEVPRRLWVDTRWSIRADAVYRRAALELLREQGRFDLLAVYFGGPDTIGHRFWRYLHPELYRHPPTREEIAALADAIPAYYAHIDAVVGELVDASPEDAVVLVLSDHGMRAAGLDSRFAPEDERRKLVSGGHGAAPACFFAAAGPGIRRAGGGPPADREQLRELGSVFDVAPTLLALLGLPLARDLEGRVLADVLAPEFLAAHPLEYVASHTPPDWHRLRPKPAVRRFEDRARAREEQLRAIGYIE